MKKKVASTVGADKVEIEKVVLSLRNSDLFIRSFFLAHGLRVPREPKTMWIYVSYQSLMPM